MSGDYEEALKLKDKEFFDMKMKFATEIKILNEDLDELVGISGINYNRCDPNRFEVELQKMRIENLIRE